MADDDDQEIYDDGTSTTNSVTRARSIFQTAMQGAKPSVATKPTTKPPTPVRSDKTQVSNGKVEFPFKKTNTNKDENSNVTNGDIKVELNQDLVSKFDSIANRFKDKPQQTPPWKKPQDSSLSAKPPEINKKPGKLPIENNLFNRVQAFQQKENNIESGAKSQGGAPSSKQSAKIAAISKEQDSKFPNKSDVKPSATDAKVETKQPPPTPRKPGAITSPSEITKPFIGNKPKPFSHAIKSPVFKSGDMQSELTAKLLKRKESIDHGAGSATTENKDNAPTEEGPNSHKKEEQIEEKPILRTRKNHVSIKRKSLTRVADNKRFLVVDIPNIDYTENPPPKPPKIPTIDLESIISEYKKQFLSSNDDDRPLSQGLIEEDVYEELPDGPDLFPSPPEEVLRHRPQSNRAVSLIEPMTEEEEIVQEDVYDEGFTPQNDDPPPPPVIPSRIPKLGNLPDLPEIPNTARQDDLQETSEKSVEDGESDGELYEPLDDVVAEVAKMEEKAKPTETTTADTKTEQLSEKERKRREKEREKEEKRRQEEEKKKQERKTKELKRYKIDTSELDPSNIKVSGKLKKDSKGKGKEMPAKKDQRVVIICMDQRVPAGYWLVALEDDTDIIGLVDSNNVEVDNTLIRTVMSNSAKKPAQIEPLDDQEEYEDIGQDEIYAEAE